MWFQGVKLWREVHSNVITCCTKPVTEWMIWLKALILMNKRAGARTRTHITESTLVIIGWAWRDVKGFKRPQCEPEVHLGLLYAYYEVPESNMKSQRERCRGKGEGDRQKDGSFFFFFFYMITLKQLSFLPSSASSFLFRPLQVLF